MDQPTKEGVVTIKESNEEGGRWKITDSTGKFWSSFEKFTKEELQGTIRVKYVEVQKGKITYRNIVKIIERLPDPIPEKSTSETGNQGVDYSERNRISARQTSANAAATIVAAEINAGILKNEGMARYELEQLMKVIIEQISSDTKPEVQ